MSSISRPPDSVLNIRKPIGWTSFDVVRWLKRRWPGEKIGHAGTLDPFAEGVLLICLGPATKRIPELMGKEKEYLARLQLGIETDSLDLSGKISCRQEVPELSLQHIVKVSKQFCGEIEQIPPLYSAVQIDGQRSYHMARAGKSVEHRVRKVTIFEIEILQYYNKIIVFRVLCSKGTYIRSLAQDFVHAFGTVGYLNNLIRTRIGEYKISDSKEISSI